MISARDRSTISFHCHLERRLCFANAKHSYSRKIPCTAGNPRFRCKKPQHTVTPKEKSRRHLARGPQFLHSYQIKDTTPAIAMVFAL